MDAQIKKELVTGGRPERRRAPRFELRLPMASYVSSARVRVENVSAGGCLAYASCVLRPGDLQEVRLRIAGAELRLSARVVHVMHVTGEPDVVCVAGLEFTDADRPDQQAAIQRLIAMVSNDRE